VLGGQEDDQPTQKAFESALFHSLSHLDPSRPVWIESESSNIGRVQVSSFFLEVFFFFAGK
jgi:tRNA 2-selenouridine synthase